MFPLNKDLNKCFGDSVFMKKDIKTEIFYAFTKYFMKKPLIYLILFNSKPSKNVL